MDRIFQKVLDYPMLYPTEIVESVERLSRNACRSRAEYEHIIYTLVPLKDREKYLK